MTEETKLRKGVVAVAVEDDMIQMIHGEMEKGEDGLWYDVEKSYSPLSVIKTPLEPLGIQESNGSTDWREQNPKYIEQVVVDYLRSCQDHGKNTDAIFISIFGNVSTRDTNIIKYRRINPYTINNDESTIDIRNAIIRNVKVPPELVWVFNDATAFAVGESIALGANDLFSSIWMGRGVNAGLVYENAAIEGFMHPEAGSVLPRLHEADEPYLNWFKQNRVPENSRDYVRNCLGELASRQAILDRQKLGMAPGLVLDIVAFYVAQLCLSITVMIAPQKICIGGHTLRSNLLNQDVFIVSVRENFQKFLGVYMQYAQSGNDRNFIVLASSSSTSSIIGLLGRLRVHLDRKNDWNPRARKLIALVPPKES